MLPEWYFCCCIESSPDQALTFLSTLETLSNPESDSRLLYLAYQELSKTEVWMQIYAIPAVLESLHRKNVPDVIRSIDNPYWQALMDLVPKDDDSREEESPFVDVMGFVLSDTPQNYRAVMATLQMCSQAIRNPGYRVISSTPYLDLKEFLPELWLLAVVADRIIWDREFASQFARNLEEEQDVSPVHRVLEDALNYRFGRYPFRIAARVAPLTLPEYAKNKRRVLSLVRRSPASVVEVEPDLLYTCAEILFMDPVVQLNAIGRKNTANNLIDEASQFRYLRQNLRYSPSRVRDFTEPIRRIGLEILSASIGQSLQLIYWQAIMWDLASQIDPRTTATRLLSYWYPPEDGGDKLVNLSYPGGVKDASEWQRQIQLLLDLRAPRPKPSVHTQPSDTLSIPDQYKWALFSPWMVRRKSKDLGKIRSDKERYPESEKPASVIRLVAGTLTATRLLQELSDARILTEFASFIAHASDVFNTVYGRWLQDYHKEKPRSGVTVLPRPLTGLVLFGRRQANWAGCGRSDSITPNTFVDILCRGSIRGEKSDTTSAEVIFLETVLPKVLVLWIQDGFAGAVDRKTGPGRWLDLIPVVYDYQPPNQGIRDAIRAALTRRFLCPEQPFESGRIPDWRTDVKDGRPREWGVDHRLLLLTERDLPADAWLKTEWYEPEDGEWHESDEHDIMAFTQSTRLVRAIERIASLKYPADISDDVIEGWRAEWRHCLNRISRSEGLDRFIRLRLLEMLDSPVLEFEDQELILVLLLEYGGAYELKEMVEIIYPETKGKESPVDGARRSVRTFLLRTLYRELETATLRLAEASNRPYAQDPRLTLRGFQKADIIRETLVYIAYCASYYRDDDRISGLPTLLAQLRQESYEEAAKLTTRKVTADIVQVEKAGIKERRIVLPENTQLQACAIRGAAFDPNLLTMTVFFDEFNTGGITNLFECSRGDVYGFLDSAPEKPSAVLAVVVSARATGDNGFRYTFNCGLPFHLSLRTHANRSMRVTKLAFKTGDYVALPIIKQGGTNRWTIPDEPGIRRLQLRSQPNRIERLAVHEFEIDYSKAKRRRLTVKLGRGSDGGYSVSDAIDLNLWDADVSRVFRRFPQPLNRSVFAGLSDQRSWNPIDQDLVDLLLRGFHYNQGRIAVLTLVQTIKGAFGETAWRFSTQPGENYVLDEYQFLPGDGERLRQVVSDLDNEDRDGSRGLLVTVSMTIESRKPCLCLVNQAVVDDELVSHYPNLRFPFDHRNIAWRNLFTETEIAERDDDDSWHVPLESNRVSGYPERIRVQWVKKYRPERDARSAEFTPQWGDDNQRVAKVDGVSLRVKRIRPKDGNWRSLFERLVNIKKGDQINLDAVISRTSRDGFVACLTDEGITVFVEAESLTMRPHTPYEIECGNRRAQISHVTKYRLETPPMIDPTEIPGDAIVEGRCEGILLEVPKGGTQCTVCWKTSEGVAPHTIRISNLGELDAHPGFRVMGLVDSDSWDFYIEAVNLRASALWSFQEAVYEFDNVCYLGAVDYQGKTGHIAEWKPGKLVLLPSVPDGVRHLATGNGVAFSNHLPSHCRAVNKARGRSWREGRFLYERAVLSILDEDVVDISGMCEANLPKNDLSVLDVSVSLVETKEHDGFFSLRRYFRLKGMAGSGVFDDQITGENSETLEKQLAEYLNNPTDLRATFRDGVVTLQTLMVPADAEHTRWTSQVPLARGEENFIREGLYSAAAFVRLFRDTGTGQVYASFRRVPPHDPDEFKKEAGATFYEYMPLEDRLYYVGPEEVDPLTGSSYTELHHRFEWGYGKTLLVKESKLRYGNYPFNRAKFILFHCDIVTGVTFLPDTFQGLNVPETNAEFEGPSCIIKIESLSIQFSQARSLFSQRSVYKIVHILHLSIRGEDQVAIDFIEGLNEGNIQTETRVFDRTPAQLSPESQNRVLKRMKREKPGEGQLTVFGRLDEELFRSTLGRTVIFEHVRLSFEPSELGSPLQDGELVFMQCGRIVDLANDTALSMGPPDILGDEDVGADLGCPLLIRRNFSVRENLLPRISQKLGRLSLAGSVLLIRIRRGRSGSVRIFMVRDVPSRAKKALAGAIASRESPLFAAVVHYRHDRELLLELKPGIFVRLLQKDIPKCPGELVAGSVVRVQNLSGNRFLITQGTFGDARYVAGDPRPVVVLPKQTLLDEKVWDNPVDTDSYWNNPCFTIGGLPNIEASPGHYEFDSSRWSGPIAETFATLMKLPHPKVAQLGRDKDSRFRVSVSSAPLEYPRVGRLEYTERSLAARYVSLAPWPDLLDNTELNWYLLSFGDESVQAIMTRAADEKWRYHDSETGAWSAGRKISRQRLGDHDVKSGPVFFEVSAKQLRLRYTEQNFRRFGYPATELVNTLNKRSVLYPVAGASDEGGLWVELAPGRLSELPGEIVVWSRGARERSLANLYWDAFAPGDQIELEAITSDPLEVDRVAFRRWLPGPRKAFGPARCFLPVGGYDETEGGLRIGAGDYGLTLPMTTPAFSSGRVALGPDNQIAKADDLLPEPGDVVLIGVNAVGHLEVLGFPSLTPKADPNSEDIWKKDVFCDDVLEPTSEGKCDINPRRIRALLRAAGGALPFTVERVSAQKLAFLSRRHQYRLSELPANRVSLARVLGLLGQRTVLLRCGGGIMKISADQLISGLPTEFFPEAVEALRNSDEMIWVRGDGQGNIRVGLNTDRSDSIWVTPLEVITNGNKPSQEAGLICRGTDSMVLYWLPASHASWARLSFDQLNRIFKSGRRDNTEVMRVRRAGKTDFVSIILSRAVEREFNNLSIGSKLTVSLTECGETTGTRRPVSNLVESFTSKVILECLTYDDERLPELVTIPVEVVQRVKGIPRSVTVAKVGQKPMSLDIPSWMLDALLKPGSPRERLRNYLVWRAKKVPDNTSASSLDGIRAFSDDKVNELLCAAYATRNEGLQAARFQVSVAAEWIRRHQNAPELDAAYAIMAILVLYANSKRNPDDLASSYGLPGQDAAKLARDWQEKAVTLTQNLGSRAQRSMHVEVLYQDWLRNEENLHRHYGLWPRLRRVLSDLQRKPLNMRDIGALRQFAYALELRGKNEDHELFRISSALYAAAGTLVSPSILYPKADVTERLGKIYRTLPFTRSGISPNLHEDQVIELDRILRFVDAQGLDITVLDPIPQAEADVANPQGLASPKTGNISHAAQRR